MSEESRNVVLFCSSNFVWDKKYVLWKKCSDVITDAEFYKVLISKILKKKNEKKSFHTLRVERENLSLKMYSPELYFFAYFRVHFTLTVKCPVIVAAYQTLFYIKKLQPVDTIFIKNNKWISSEKQHTAFRTSIYIIIRDTHFYVPQCWTDVQKALLFCFNKYFIGYFLVRHRKTN